MNKDDLKFFIMKYWDYIKQYLMLMLNCLMGGFLIFLAFPDLNDRFFQYPIQAAAFYAISFTLSGYKVDDLTLDLIKNLSIERMVYNLAGIAIAAGFYLLLYFELFLSLLIKGFK